MSRKSTFNSNGIVNHTRKTLLIPSFAGDDLTSPQTMVSERRAIYSNNYMYRDGYVQKRFAYVQIAKPEVIHFYEMKMDGTEGEELYGNQTRINGMWNFIAEDGKKHVVAHIGYLLFEVKSIKQDPYFKLIGGYKTAEGKIYSYKFLDQRSYAAIGQKRLWFLGGNAYVVVRFDKDTSKPTITRVCDSDITFVPTTTIGITYKDAITGKRSGLDYPNMLSKFRKNMLLSGVGKTKDSQTKWYEYTLDGPIAFENENKDMAEMTEEVTKRGEVLENGK